MVNASPSLLPPVAPRPAQVGLLADIAAGLAGGSDLADLLAQFLAPIVRLAGAQAGTVRALSAAGDRLELVGTFGLASQSCSGGKAADSHCGACGAAAHGQPIVWIGDPDHSADAATADMPAGGCRHVLVLPLQHRGRTLGVCQLFMGEADRAVGRCQARPAADGGRTARPGVEQRAPRAADLHTACCRNARHMAAEVHDSLAQSLAVAKMRMPLLHDAIRAHDDERAEAYHDDVRRRCRRRMPACAASSRTSGCRWTHAACWWRSACAEDFRRSSGAELRLRQRPGRCCDLPQEQEAQVFHIVQEALANMARHAAPTACTPGARAQRPDGHGDMQVLVEDDGDGLPAQPDGGSHHGLQIMQERARRLGGSLETCGEARGRHEVRLDFPAPAAALQAS
jgi:two-component system nitrate/nitrite sensor histidine kinase NarX